MIAVASILFLLIPAVVPWMFKKKAEHVLIGYCASAGLLIIAGYFTLKYQEVTEFKSVQSLFGQLIQSAFMIPLIMIAIIFSLIIGAMSASAAYKQMKRKIALQNRTVQK